MLKLVDKKKKIKSIFKKTAKIGLKILLWVQVGLLSIVALFGIIGCINDAKTYTAKADSISTQYVFNGSNIWLYSYYFQMSDLVPKNTVNSSYSFRWSFSTLQPELGQNPYISFVFSHAYNGYSANSLLSFYDAETFVISSPADTQNTNGVQLRIQYGGLGVSKTVGYYVGVSDGYPYVFNCTYLNIKVSTVENALFSANIKRVDMGNEVMYNGFFVGKDYYVRPADYYNYLRYTDVNGSYVELQFPLNCSPSYQDSFLMKNRTYYLTGDISDSDIYQEGFQDGLIQNAQDEYDKGYEAGKEAYEGSGYNKGYADGLEAGSDGVGSLGWFFQNALSVLDVKIFGFVSLGDLFKLVVGVSLVLILLKIFAGG